MGTSAGFLCAVQGGQTDSKSSFGLRLRSGFVSATNDIGGHSESARADEESRTGCFADAQHDKSGLIRRSGWMSIQVKILDAVKMRTSARLRARTWVSIEPRV